ncbi:glycoside hydrolase family 6 protein [Deinococcus sp. HMF7604]|uniref:glycoside hydrolase family 6 protein n=1 Tax=Deinococcus betulae TaxID=2873312 RepID=UPI001CC8EE0D|nr:glycoside hydrolase family 6 protein [Deinococcus betulae]MBZ9750792.1 glycoside hydrolase family 6 protein [Deinococcus betulae]
MQRSALMLSTAFLLAACGQATQLTPQAQAQQPQLSAQAVSFYADPGGAAATWVRNNPNDGRTSLIRSRVSTQPAARWFGNWSGDVRSSVNSYAAAAAQAGKTPILVAYNIIGRDCGQHSSGGAGSADAYRTWIRNFSLGLGQRAAVVVVEPDALAQLTQCLNASEQSVRLGLLSYAVDQLATNAPNAKVYLDAGNSNWIGAADMADRLKKANVARARGFALNVSNYYLTSDSTTYGNAVTNALNGLGVGGRRFVIDTSRNGAGPAGGEWCNPGGRKLGSPSQVTANTSGLEMLLWIKNPGESDGNCGIGGGSSAGQFLPQAAYDMAR